MNQGCVVAYYSSSRSQYVKPGGGMLPWMPCTQSDATLRMARHELV
jgi:hypothetical protein